jgi:hypothetical protein
MSRLLAVIAVLAMAVLAQGALAQEQSATVTIRPAEARVGERVTLTIEVLAPAGSAVELDLAATELGAAEIAESRPVETDEQDGQVLHRLRYQITAFEPGRVSVRPAVRLTSPDGAVNALALPAAGWTIVSVLPPGEAPTEIRDLQPQMAVGGAGFAYTSEAIVVGAVAAAVLLLALAWWLLRRYLRRPRVAVMPAPIPAEVLARGALDELSALEPGQETLPSVYARIATVVRRYLGAEYRFPAASLTSRELQSQMVERGVPRWQARMATSLLAECDAVAYAGYRPAAARLKADLDMAYQIVAFDPAEAEQAQIISFQRPGVSE